MRDFAGYQNEGCGTFASARPGMQGPMGSTEDPGTAMKVDLTSLLPGGMTQDAYAGLFRALHAGSPEPVIGYGGMKGIAGYYRAVRFFLSEGLGEI